MLLSGKNIIITGATSGIGKASAIEAAHQGANLILLGRQTDKLDSLLDSLRGQQHLAFTLDFESVDVEKELSVVFSNIPKVDGVFHCAGQHIALPLKACSIGVIERLFKINVTSSILLLKEVRKRNNHNKACSVVLMSSASGLVGEKGLSTYSSTKGALVSLTKSLSAELVADSIRVNCISAGIVKSEMTMSLFEKMTEAQLEQLEKKHPLGFGSVNDVADSAVFLLSDMSKWITGSNLIVDGGYTAVK